MIPLASILLYIRLASLIISYGFKLVKWFREKYEKVEKEATTVAMTPDDKAHAFNRGVHNDIMHAENRSATKNELNEIREAVWTASNPGKTPKRLKDPKLRVRAKVGKTAGA